MEKIFEEFKEYCEDPNIESGKAVSYARAIKYLCEFFNFNDKSSSLSLKKQMVDIEPEVQNKEGLIYSDFLQFLTARGQKSYLSKGFIRAAIPHFILFLSDRENEDPVITKLDAIKEVIKECDGHATWDDIYSKASRYYPHIKKSVEWKAEIRGVLYRDLKNNKTFKRNVDGSFSLINDIENSTRLGENGDDIICNSLKDNQIKAKFDKNKTIGILPINNESNHRYLISKKSGTAVDGLRKVYDGRKAEKYFLDFLKRNGYVQDIDYFDVANQKTEGFDVKFFDFGLEIKNIKNGGFYLSDNEIALLENHKTNLILVDIDNGIWLLKSTSLWLKKTILNIKTIRGYCKSTYSNLDLTDIKINLDNEIKKEIFEITNLLHKEIYESLAK